MQAKQVCHKLLNDTCSMMHKMRRLSLEAIVMAALSGTRLTVTDLGRSIDSLVKPKYCIKRADRLLSNTHCHAEREAIYAKFVQRLIGSRKRPIIIVDWSDMDDCKRHFLLRAALAVDGRSFTLYEEVHTVKSKEKPKSHLNFLKKFKAMLAADCRPIIVSDAGFRVPWFKLVESFGWDWIGRVRNRTFVQLAADDESWFPCKALYDNATTIPKALGAAHMAEYNPIACQLVLYKGKPKGRVHKNRLGKRSKATRSRRAEAQGKEPWLLATSLAPCSKLAKKVVALYTLRMQIEESFRDLKSTRFGLSLELHLTYQVERLQVMLLIASLALMVAWLMGKATELTEQHWQYQANTVRTRKVLSTIFIGLKMIDDKRTTLTAR
ncbi:MAG: IS4 family transposase, partial [Proteobacteria bacterium]|nr:IS4 family transposase [Pseudomonadota bacterium]